VFKLLDNLVTKAELERLNTLLSTAAFESGVVTAGPAARSVKDNLQATSTQPCVDEARSVMREALLRSEEFREYAYPLRFVPPLFSRYEPGMRYGEHTDNAVMGNVRTDLALTLFLSPPDSYEGGELVVDVDQDARMIKLAAGCAVVYEASSLHRVEPVRRGRREAGITWVQSLVRDPAQREILAGLSATLRLLGGTATNSRAALTVAKTRANLLRMWAEV